MPGKNRTSLQNRPSRLSRPSRLGRPSRQKRPREEANRPREEAEVGPVLKFVADEVTESISDSIQEASTNEVTDIISDSIQEASTSSAPRNFTQDQVEAVKRVRRCKNYYEILGLAKEANEADLKKSYR